MTKYHIRSIIWVIILLTTIGLPLFWVIAPNPLNNTTEEQLLQQAEQRILQIRRGNITLEFGANHANQEVYIQQLTQAFRFGCDVIGFGDFSNDTVNQLYEKYFSAMFNFATVPVYWGYYEPVQGEYPYDAYLHNITAWLESFGAVPKCHPIIWQNDVYTPSWMASLNQTEQHAAAIARIDQVLSDFSNVNTFDLVNEMTRQPNTWLGNTDVQTWETALTEARKDRPTAQFIANDYDYGEYSTITAPNPATDAYYQFLKQISTDGYTPDAMGLQFHCLKVWYPIEGILSALDVYGQLRIPIDITEFLPSSIGFYQMGSYHGVITEQSQAEYAYRTYITLFSHPAVQAITWWDFANTSYYLEHGWNAGWQGLSGGYMMDSSGRLLPVYNTLYNLIHVTWNSTSSVQLDASGSTHFTGFYGSYSATFSDGSKQYFNITNTTPASQQAYTLQDLG